MAAHHSSTRSGFLVAVVLIIQRLAAGELAWEELEAWLASQSAIIAR